MNAWLTKLRTMKIPARKVRLLWPVRFIADLRALCCKAHSDAMVFYGYGSLELLIVQFRFSTMTSSTLRRSLPGRSARAEA
jgi:hypothetical protein